MIIIALILMLTLSANAQQILPGLLGTGTATVAGGGGGNDAYPVARRSGLPDNLWVTTGVSGGVPNSLTMTVFTNFSPGVTTAQLSNGIAVCPSNQVVQMAAGSYDFSGAEINVAKNGVVLRGATNASGAPTTLFSNCQIDTADSGFYRPDLDPPTTGITIRNVSSGYTEGSTSITLATAPNSDFAVGSMFVIDQTDDGTTVATDTDPYYYTLENQSYAEVLLCTNISGSTLGFTPPLIGNYWNASQTPQVYGWASHSTTHHRVGIENIDITEGTGAENYETVRMMNCFDSWIKNVRVNVTPYASASLMWSVNCSIVDGIFHDSSDTGSGTYAMMGAVATACRFENNISSNVSLVFVSRALVGCAVTYNFASPPYPYDGTWLAEQFFLHGGHGMKNLFEGNHVANIEFDDVFDNNNSENGIIRNRLHGWATGKTGNTYGIILGEDPGSNDGVGDHRNTTILGNVLGTDSYHGSYASIVHVESEVTGSYFTNNYNVFNDAIPSGETLVGDTIRTSYAYNSKPAWFGSLPWPPFDSASPTASLTLHSETNIPAGYRSYYGTFPPP